MASVGGRRRLGGIGGRTRSRDHIVEEFVPYAGWTEDSNAHYLHVDLPGFNKEDVKIQVDSTGNIIISGERQIVNEDKYVYFDKTYTVPQNSDIEKITGKLEKEFLTITVPKQVAKAKEESETANENVAGKAEEIKHEKPTTNNENLNRDGDQHGNDHGSQSEKENESSEKEKESKGNTQTEGIGEKEKESKGNTQTEGIPEATIKKRKRECNILKFVMKMLNRNKGTVATAVLAFSLGVFVTRKLESTGQLREVLT